MNDEPLLTVPEVAQRLRVTAETVRRWLRAGRLRGARISDAAGYRIPRSEVARLLRELGLPPAGDHPKAEAASPRLTDAASWPVRW